MYVFTNSLRQLTFKEHFKYLWAACDTKFPKHLWFQIIP